jgi:pimeloyl-ACP methyl ester carboxylesterase
MQIAHQTLTLSRLPLHVATLGVGDPVVLLHGWPQTWHEWRKLAPLLAGRYRLVMPDLPGLGDSGRPRAVTTRRRWRSTSARCAIFSGWADSTSSVTIGAAHRVRAGVRGPGFVRTLTILDVTIPGIGPDISQGGKRWHHAFHMTPDLPEALVQGREREYLTWFYREFSWQPGAIEPSDIDEYVRCYSLPGALSSGFAYYRNIPRDKADNVAILESGFRLPMPVLALGGGRPEARGRGEEPLESLRCIASDVRGGALPDCGHFIAEEQPALLAARLLEFFAQH